MSDISLQMYTLREHMQSPAQAEETLRRVSEIGYRNVQPGIPAFWTAEALRKAMDTYGLRADSFPWLEDNISARLDDIVRVAEILDCTVVRTGAISLRDAQTREGALAYAQRINAHARALAARGLTYIYHFHAYEFVDLGGETCMDILLRETDAVAFQPDVHWMAAAGLEPSVALDMFAGRAPYIHMQGYAILPDPEVKNPVNRCTVPVGQGTLNWPGIMRAARRNGVRLYVVEQDDCYIDAFESIRQSFSALVQLGAQA